MLKNTFHIFIDGNTNASSFASIRKALKNLDGRQNNRHLLKILRSNSILFASHETVNHYNMDFIKWFEMLSQVRHCITHRRMMLDNDMLNNLPDCYKQYFEERNYDNKRVLYLKKDQGPQLLIRITEYMFFVYKSIVQTCYPSQLNLVDLEPLFTADSTDSP